uniref:Uncharacterized protein n=1 Tax=Rhizophora mucronata TaxID=61149 RepID=A0A2P2QJ57_RHIMU
MNLWSQTLLGSAISIYFCHSIDLSLRLDLYPNEIA